MNGFKAYTDNSVTTQSRGRLIIMLYEGAIKFLKMAISEIEAGNQQSKGVYINKAQNIISELNAVLDMDNGGEIAANLRKLYLFMGHNLSQANIKQDPEMIRVVIRLIEQLNNSFKEITY